MQFRSLAVLAFAACATFVSAAPAPSPLELMAARATADLTLAMRDMTTDSTVAIAAREPALAEIDGKTLPKPAQVLKDMTTKLTPIVQKLKAAVADKKQLKKEEIVGYLNDITAILKLTHDQLKTIAKNPAGFATGLLSLGTIFTTLGPFLQLIFSVLALVLKVVANTPLGPVVQPLLTVVAGLLSSILTIVFSLLPGLLALLSPVLAILSPILRAFQLDGLLTIINIPGLNL